MGILEEIIMWACLLGVYLFLVVIISTFAMAVKDLWDIYVLHHDYMEDEEKISRNYGSNSKDAK